MNAPRDIPYSAFLPNLQETYKPAQFGGAAFQVLSYLHVAAQDRSGH